jgi:hypothetical protein
MPEMVKIAGSIQIEGWGVVLPMLAQRKGVSNTGEVIRTGEKRKIKYLT